MGCGVWVKQPSNTIRKIELHGLGKVASQPHPTGHQDKLRKQGVSTVLSTQKAFDY